MKILVLGCNGMAGHVISLFLEEKEYEVYGFARRPSPFLRHSIVGDARDFDKLRETIINGKFDIIINCIGILNCFAEKNKGDAIIMNSFLPHFLVDVADKSGAKVIHMSTDCVFAGNDGPYTEESIPNGKSFYDRTKALGEINNSRDLTFRNSIIGPDININGIGLFNWFMHQSGCIKGYTGAIWTGVTTYELASGIEKAICQGLSGIYNFVNNQRISKYDLLSLFNKYFCDKKITIIPDSTVQIDKTLICTRTDFAVEIPDYESQIKDLYNWIIKHKAIYKNYNIC